jgi:hypothetical protein
MNCSMISPLRRVPLSKASMDARSKPCEKQHPVPRVRARATGSCRLRGQLEGARSSRLYPYASRATQLTGAQLHSFVGSRLRDRIRMCGFRHSEGKNIVARLRRFVAAGINVSLPEPHSPERYVELIQAIFNRRMPVRVRGDQHVMISSLANASISAGYLEGTLARFTEIDADLPWFNLERLDQAEDTDRLSISIPESLRPNYKPFLFYFDIKSHTFVFEQSSGSQSLSVWGVQKFLSESVNADEIAMTFGSVSISLIQSEEALDVIFGLRNIRKLRILYRLPNPDDHSSLLISP